MSLSCLIESDSDAAGSSGKKKKGGKGGGANEKVAEEKYRNKEEESFHKNRMTKYPPITMPLKDANSYYVDPENVISCVPLSQIGNKFKTKDGKKRFVHSAKPGIDASDLARQAEFQRTADLNKLDRGRDWWILIDVETGLDHWCLDVSKVPALAPKHKMSDVKPDEPILMELTLEKYKNMACFTNLLYGRSNSTILEDFRGLAPTRLLISRALSLQRTKAKKDEDKKKDGDAEGGEGEDAAEEADEKPAKKATAAASPAKKAKKEEPAKKEVEAAEAEGAGDIGLRNDDSKLAWQYMKECEADMATVAEKAVIQIDELTAKFGGADLPKATTLIDLAIDYVRKASKEQLQAKYTWYLNAAKNAADGSAFKDDKLKDFAQFFTAAPKDTKSIQPLLSNPEVRRVLVPIIMFVARHLAVHHFIPITEQYGANFKAVSQATNAHHKTAQSAVESAEARVKHFEAETKKATAETKAAVKKLKEAEAEIKALKDKVKAAAAAAAAAAAEEKPAASKPAKKATAPPPQDEDDDAPPPDEDEAPAPPPKSTKAAAASPSKQQQQKTTTPAPKPKPIAVEDDDMPPPDD